MEYTWKQINLTVFQVSITIKVRRGGSPEELTSVTLGHHALIIQLKTKDRVINIVL